MLLAACCSAGEGTVEGRASTATLVHQQRQKQKQKQQQQLVVLVFVFVVGKPVVVTE